MNIVEQIRNADPINKLALLPQLQALSPMEKLALLSVSKTQDTKLEEFRKAIESDDYETVLSVSHLAQELKDNKEAIAIVKEALKRVS